MGLTNPPNRQRGRFASSRHNRTAKQWIRPPSSTSYSNWRLERGMEMRTCNSFGLAIILAGLLAGSVSAQTTQTADQTQPQTGTNTSAPVVTVDQAIDHLIAWHHPEGRRTRVCCPYSQTKLQTRK